MKASIENIGKNKDGATILKVVTSDVGAEALRLGAIELTQRKLEQTQLGEEPDEHSY